MDWPTPIDDLAKVSELFRQAEAKLKLIERLHSQELVVPSVNELRYAGFHILQAVNASSPEARQEAIRKAENHCKRAIYDALEVGVIDRLNAFKRFEDDYRLVQIAGVIPDYIELRGVAREAQALIGNLAPPSSRENRDHYFEQIEQHFIKLCQSVDLLTDARPELNKALAERRRQFKWFLITVGIALVGAIFAGLALR